MDKNTLRRQMLQLRSQLRPKFMETSGRRMGGQLAALPAFRDAQTVMLYHSCHNEADTLPLLRYCLKVKKRVVLPVTDDEFVLHPYEIADLERLRTDPRGIAEPDPEFCVPVDPLSIDLAVIPGLAFDTGGGRIGYGKGNPSRGRRQNQALNVWLNIQPFQQCRHSRRHHFPKLPALHQSAPAVLHLI